MTTALPFYAPIDYPLLWAVCAFIAVPGALLVGALSLTYGFRKLVTSS